MGLGTSAPHHRLSVIGGQYWTTNNWFGSVELANASAIGWRANSPSKHHGLAHGAGRFYFFHRASDPGTAVRAATYDMVIKDYGNVGIGTINPADKLHVNGNLCVTDGDIDVKGQKMDMPDYIFEPDYALLPLNALRAYVAEEQPLPNVPDAEQIAEGGLNVSEFQQMMRASRRPPVAKRQLHDCRYAASAHVA